MSLLTPEVTERMYIMAKGHIAIFVCEKSFTVNGISHIAAITMMIRQDDSIYYRCIIDRYKVIDLENLQIGSVAGWVDLEIGMTAISRSLGAVIEQLKTN